MKKTYTILSLLFFVINSLYAQETNAIIEAGNNFYRNKKYKEAEAEYLKALDNSPGHPVATYNYASTLYRNDDGSKAIGVLDTLLRTEKDNKIRSV